VPRFVSHKKAMNIWREEATKVVAESQAPDSEETVKPILLELQKTISTIPVQEVCFLTAPPVSCDTPFLYSTVSYRYRPKLTNTPRFR